MKYGLLYERLLDPMIRFMLTAGDEGGTDNGGSTVAPDAARAYLADYGHGADALKALPDPDVLKLHGTVTAALDKHRPVQTDWHTGITDAALKPVAERYKTPEEAIRALATPQDWRAGVTDENLKKIAEPFKTPADALKALADKSGDWRSNLTDEAKEFAKNSPDIAHLVGRAVDMRKQLSNAIVRPGKDAKPEEVAAYKKALGQPEKAEEYVAAFAKPPHLTDEEFKSENVQGVYKGFAEFAHKETTISRDDLAKVVNWYGGVEAATLKAQVDADNKFAEDSRTQLMADWGKDADRNFAAENLAHEKLFGANLDAAKRVENKAGQFVLDDPVFRRAFAALGLEMGEGSLGSTLSEGERSTINDQIADVSKRRKEASAAGNSKVANELYRQEMDLIGKRDGNKPIVGAARAA